ncbi:queuosine precursor transporter [Paraflavitalea pollutisoli]|uniref:queuosine precursor transporter n=1 Tax=Paraflavitalea pollutisoli TaxID=3034143 RepID=UPI0023EE284B|nr:queuosine precursor transporter [Paraflavitalea sp. H1-2-19X]
MIHNIIKDKGTRLFIILGGFFIANAIIAEVTGVKVFSLEDTLGLPKASIDLLGQKGLSFSLTVGVIPWPVIFVMTDIINEYYGVRGVRFLSLLTVVLIAFAFLVFYLGIHTVPDGGWRYRGLEPGVTDQQGAYVQVLGQGMNIIIGSIAAFLLGQLLDAFIFRGIKRVTGEKAIWMRATISTLASQFIDSIVVTFVAFYLFKDFSLATVTAWALTAYMYKFIVAVLMTPVIYGVHGIIERYLGHELAANMKEAAMRDK